MLAYRMHEQFAGHDQNFLVRQHHPFSSARGSQRGLKPGSPDDGRHHGVNFGQGG